MAYLVTHFILVAGHEYSTKGLDFDRMCTHRAQEWIDGLRARTRSHGTFSSLRLTPPVTLRFLRFHFTKGVVEYIDFDLDSDGGKVVALTEKSWTPVANFSGDAYADPRKVCPTRTMRAIKASDYKKSSPTDVYPTFISTGPDADQVMSIVDVYTTLQKMGQTDPFTYSVVELSFFSHGWPGGPILVNSDQQPGTVPKVRDPLDKDGRRKDWLPDMGAGDNSNTLKQFVNAFEPIWGFLQVWGCVAEPPMRHVLVQAFVKRRMQSDDVGKKLRGLKPIDDDESFDFDFSDPGPDPWTDDYSVDKTFFPHSTSVTTFSRTFLDIKQLLARLIEKTYVYRCALHAEIKAKGAIYGMEGDDEKHQKYNLMRVCISMSHEPTPPQECPVGYGLYLQFFETYFGLKHDPVRGYGLFDSDLVTTITSLTSPPS